MRLDASCFCFLKRPAEKSPRETRDHAWHRHKTLVPAAQVASFKQPAQVFTEHNSTSETNLLEPTWRRYFLSKPLLLVQSEETMSILSPNESRASRESGIKKKKKRKKWKKEMEQQKKWLMGGCWVSQASEMSLIEADAWQTRRHSIARAATEAADRG